VAHGGSFDMMIVPEAAADAVADRGLGAGDLGGATPAGVSLNRETKSAKSPIKIVSPRRCHSISRPPKGKKITAPLFKALKFHFAHVPPESSPPAVGTGSSRQSIPPVSMVEFF